MAAMNGTPPDSRSRVRQGHARQGSACTLYSGVRNLLRCDGGDVVAGIVTFVLSQRQSLRFAAGVLNRAKSTPVADAVMLANGIRCFLGVHPSGRGQGAVTVARLSNERRAIRELQDLLPDQPWTELVFHSRASSIAGALPGLARTASTWRRIAGIARRLHERHDAFRAYRVVELLFYYQRYAQLFARRTYQLAVMSSHSNPHGIALNLAASRYGVPVILITHGMPVSPIARLDYDLAIMECEASADVYRRAGCRMGRVIVKSRKRDFTRMSPCPLPERLTIGIFLSKDPNEDGFVRSAESLLADARVKRILVRPHPVNLWPDLARCVARFGDGRVGVSRMPGIPDDLRQCDVVVAANSTVHVEALLAGKPSCYLRGLDHAPFDVQSFVRDGLVYHLQDASLLDPAAVRRFYSRPEWPTVFQRYAEVDRDAADVARDVRAAVRDLTAGRGD